MAVAVLAATNLVSSGGPAQAQAPTNRWLTERRVANIAHGGGLNEAPQGTMFAYATAADRGADVLEMDLQITRDGHVIAMHDSTVDRTTNGTGCVIDKTLAEIRELDAAYTFVPGEGVRSGRPEADYTMRGIATGDRAAPTGFTAEDFRPVTLEELFDAFPDSLMVMELKPIEAEGANDCPASYEGIPEAERPDVVAEVARLIDEYGMEDEVLVASFVDELMTRFQELAPDVDTSYPLGESLDLYMAYTNDQPAPNPNGHEAIQVPTNYGGIEITEELVVWARANGIAVHFWTINDPNEMNELLDWGADGLITDDVEVLDQVLRERGDPRPTVPTTTVPPSTTDTTDTTEPTDTTAGPAASTTAAESAAAETTTGSGDGSLPATGSDTNVLIAVAAVLLALGAAALLGRRRLSR